MISNLKRQLFPKGIKRGLRNYQNRLINRTSEKKLVGTFSRLGFEKGAVICIHAMLSGLGYIEGGPQTIFRSLQKVVPDCTILMPTFPFDGSTQQYLANGPIYDKNVTPSKSGLLSETLRLFPGAQRSFHPTHPCVAVGPRAGELIDGSEISKTPFGDDSSYGRYCLMDEAVQLLIHTNSSSIVHRVQEVVNIPNLFQDDLVVAKGIGPDGKNQRI